MRSAAIQLSCGMLSSAPKTIESASTASIRYRPGTSSPISRLATRRGSTSEMTLWRTTQRLAKTNAPPRSADIARSAMVVRVRTRQSAEAPMEAYHRCSVYSEAIARPASRNTAAAASTAISHRRELMLDPHALRAQPGFHRVPDLLQPRGRPCLEAQHEDRLGIRGADQAPSVAEEHARAVHVD